MTVVGQYVVADVGSSVIVAAVVAAQFAAAVVVVVVLLWVGWVPVAHPRILPGCFGCFCC